ncbi:MAG TPA: sulfite exporter TauE/SafE family protein [Bryobacteraceae bacterium]|nr:sulfite exporter TauE/SafE family protein [Bryobacteraceae bacterium]
MLLTGLVGLSLGLLGSGGSIVAVPVLVYAAGIPVRNAVAMSLAIVGGTSLVGAIQQYRRRRLHLRAMLYFIAAGAVGAYLGAGLTHRVPPRVLMLLFAAVMLAVGASMLHGRRDYPAAGRCRPLRCLLAGAAVGALTGFLGVGGGFLIVPALVLVAGLEMGTATGTSLAVIALNCAAGFAGQWSHAPVDAPLTLAFLAMALLGLQAGLRLAGRFSDRGLRRAFAASVMVAGAVIGAENLWWLARS